MGIGGSQVSGWSPALLGGTQERTGVEASVMHPSWTRSGASHPPTVCGLRAQG